MFLVSFWGQDSICILLFSGCYSRACLEAEAEENGANGQAKAKVQAIQDQITTISERVSTDRLEAFKARDASSR
jgi:hypothetical protein